MSLYFPKMYEQDLLAYKALGKDCLCGRVIDDIRNNHSDKIFHLRQFYVHNFFLTIFSEVIKDHFPKYSERWRQECYEYIDYKCTYNDRRLFWAIYTKRKKYKGETMRVHPAEYIHAAQEVTDYADKIFEKEGFEGLTEQMIRDHIVNSEDHPEGVQIMVSDEQITLIRELQKAAQEKEMEEMTQGKVSDK